MKHNNSLEIDRNTFTEIIYERDRIKYIYERYESLGWELFQTDSFIFMNNEGDVNIIEKDHYYHFPRWIGWYKLYHVGRCLTIGGIETIEELNVFIDEIVEELKEKGIKI